MGGGGWEKQIESPSSVATSSSSRSDDMVTISEEEAEREELLESVEAMLVGARAQYEECLEGEVRARARARARARIFEEE